MQKRIFSLVPDCTVKGIRSKGFDLQDECGLSEQQNMTEGSLAGPPARKGGYPASGKVKNGAEWRQCMLNLIWTFPVCVETPILNCRLEKHKFADDFRRKRCSEITRDMVAHHTWCFPRVIGRYLIHFLNGSSTIYYQSF